MDNFFILETSICEIEEYISLFDECDHTSSIPELSILMNDQKRTSIRLYSSITPQIQYLIYQYPIYEDKYFQIYRTHNFLKTIYSWYAPYRSYEIFGQHKEQFDSYQVLTFYKSLTYEEKKKLIEFSNIINSEK